MCSKETFHQRILQLVTAFTVLWGAQHAVAVTLDEAIAFIADRVELYMADQGQSELFIETFAGPAGINAKRVEQGVREKLAASKKVKLAEDSVGSPWKLTGRLSVDPDDSTRFKILVELLDKGDNRLTGFDKQFDEGKGKDGSGENIPKESKPVSTDKSTSPAAQVVVDAPSDAPIISSVNADVQTPVERIVGRSADAPLPDDIDDNLKVEAKKAAKEALSTAFKRPQFFSQPEIPTQIRASKESKFSLEIRVAKSPDGPYVPVTPRNRSGKAFLDLKEGDYFEVQVMNGNNFDCGVELLLDGINSMHFCEDEKIKNSGKWLIKQNTKGTVTGWFVRNDKQGIKRFLIASEPAGVAARLGRPQKIGSIQANFYMAYAENSVPPMFVALGDTPMGAVTDGVPTDFNGTVEARMFDRGFPLACISVLHSNPDPPSDLPPQ